MRQGDGEAAGAGRRYGEPALLGDLGPDDGGVGLTADEVDAGGVTLDRQLGVCRLGGDEVVGGGASPAIDRSRAFRRGSGPARGRPPIETLQHEWTPADAKASSAWTDPAGLPERLNAPAD
jgi:hypothetical protein